MNCEEFEAIGLDAERDATLSEAARVEMRLRQEFRTQYVTRRVRRAAVAVGWVLAAAAVLAGAVSWRNWRHSQLEETTNHLNSVPAVNKIQEDNSAAGGNRQILAVVPNGMPRPVSAGAGSSETLVADNELRGFTFLPGAFFVDTEEAAILRVRMQRGALGALGLPVNEERASEWIQVDLLVDDEGLPQAVRLAQ